MAVTVTTVGAEGEDPRGNGQREGKGEGKNTKGGNKTGGK